MERKKAFAIVISLSVILSIPLVLSSGLVDVSLFSPSAESGSYTALVFADPAIILDDALQSGSYFTVYVNFSVTPDGPDLYTWHAKVSWDKTLLSASEIVYGDLLSGTISPNGTSADVANITGIFNDDGYVWAAESVLGEYPGVNDNGTLLAIEFLVVGYGSTDLIISDSGTLPTTLLDSAGGNITYGKTDGYFRNKYPGDIDGTSPWDCDYDDFLAFAAAYLKTSGQPGYNREADFDFDGDVDYDDFLVFAANYLKTFP